ncbi:MAG: hypothetical protein E7Z65_08305 [Thermoplasmata archaeon]|jgi:hypothetical protein|nr:hypothetical protein [Thermoplasmata archaeon]
MTSTKYEREIRFLGKEATHLKSEKESILAKGQLTAEDEARIKVIDETVARYEARKKEIEDSYIEAGLELPLASRNLNASVYPIGASFEPVGRDYRKELIDETNARNAIAAKAYEGYEVPETDDIDELNAMVKEMTERLSNMEHKIMEADLADELGEKTRLQEEADKLRFRRDNTVNKIKALKSEGYRSAEGSGLSKEFQDKIMQHDEQIAAVKTQIAMVRGEIYEVKDMLMTIMERLGMGRNDFNQDD